MADLQLFLFGPPRLEYHGRIVECERRKAVALIAYLAMSEQPQSRDSLATMLWPESDQTHARAALRTILPSLTTILPNKLLVADRMTISLKQGAIWTDVHQFLSLLTERKLHSHPPDNLCHQCADLLAEAATLYHRDFLDGFTLPDSPEYDEWQLLQREWLRREFANVLQNLAQYYWDQEKVDQALLYARRWLILDPLHEPAHRLLMRLYMSAGQRTEALRQYQECLRILDIELSVVPEEETTELYECIKSNTKLAPREKKTAQLRSGMLPPLPNLLIGREDVILALKKRIGLTGLTTDDRHPPVTVIQGWPGVGKSTTVSALAHDAEVTAAFPDGILWASLGVSPSILTELSKWADLLKVFDVSQSRNVTEITAQLTAMLGQKKMLLIVDDIWQAEHAQAFKISSHACAMILITRFNDVAQMLAPTPNDIYKMPVLGQAQAFQLLQILAPEAVRDHPVEANELIKALDGLPLALQVAGRLLHSEYQFGWSVEYLLSELRQGTRLLASPVPADMQSIDVDVKPTIEVLLRRSIDSLDVQTKQCFISLGFFAPKPATFDLDALAAVWDMDDPKPTVRVLINRGLLEPVGAGRFQIHALLAMHARSLTF